MQNLLMKNARKFVNFAEIMRSLKKSKPNYEDFDTRRRNV